MSEQRCQPYGNKYLGCVSKFNFKDCFASYSKNDGKTKEEIER